MAFKLLIVNYHYFRTGKPVSGIYPVTPDEFKSQLEALSRQFRFCAQEDIVRWLSVNEFPDQSYCLITFDDGLAEQMAAAEILRSKGIPGIFFIPVKPYLDGTVLAVHKLHYIRSILADEDLFNILLRTSDIENYAFDETALNLQYRYDNPLAQKIKFYLNFALSLDESEKLIDKVFNQIESDEEAFARKLYMEPGHLKDLASLNMLGSHGTRHRPLATLPSEEIRKDIDQSLSFLQQVTGTEVRSFAYPYGSQAAVNDEAAIALETTSVRFALTMFRGINTSTDFMRPYLLRRVDTHDAPGGKRPLPDLL